VTSLRDITPNNVRKFMRYSFDAASFTPSFDHPAISARALRAAACIRGADRGPAILLHGIMPRSGTVYVGELLRLHPDIYAFPNHIWEFPFLQHAGEVARLQQHFLQAYEQNADKIGELDFLPLFGAALIAYMHASTPPGKRLLLKIPSVQYLTHFFDMFPHENLLLLTRDGRDVAQSTRRTWPVLRFPMICVRWRRAADMALAFDRAFCGRTRAYARARFEDAVDDPAAFVAGICERFGLDAARFPYDRLTDIPVHGSSALATRDGVTWDAQPKPRGFSPQGRWQDWPAVDRWLFKRIAGKQLIALGYCKDLNW
jgi:protein-tyrosine sulfotransferase